jgi:hypothetical protein
MRTSCLQSKPSMTWITTPVHFALIILEMGSPELFAWVGLKLWSSSSQPPQVARIIGECQCYPAKVSDFSYKLYCKVQYN